MLLVGGLVAFINPLAGFAVAAQAIIPGLGGMLAKFGLREAGSKWNRVQLNRAIRAAERQVLSEFKGSRAFKIQNPILRQLELSLNTGEDAHDPLLEIDLGSVEVSTGDNHRLRGVTLHAITVQYAPVLRDKRQCADAQLRQKEIRWLGLIGELAGYQPL